MTAWLWGLFCGVVLAGLAQLWGLRRAARLKRRLLADLATRPNGFAVDLPAVVRAYAQSAGATGAGRQVRFTQEAEMELSPGAGWRPYRTWQWVSVPQAGFVWLAERRVAGLPILSVVDSYVRGRGLLVAWMMGSVPVARAEGAELDRAEAMRYLAELPWAPDAILANAALEWQVLAPDHWRVSLGAAVVDFHLDAAGDIARITARDRPALVKGQTVLRDWRGVFTDYAVIADRRIPMRAEVGYVTDDAFAPYFRGRITAYQLD